MQNATDIAQARLPFYRNTESNSTNSNSIELPGKIKRLVTGPAKWQLAKSNRYKKLIREGHLNDLLELAELASTKTKPDCWFAKVCSVARWEDTQKWLQKAREVARTATEVARRLAVQPGQLKAVYKACWRLKSAAVPKAILAKEIVTEKGGNALRLFNYLCWKSE